MHIEAANMLIQKGFYVTDIPVLDSSSLKEALGAFMALDPGQRREYLQQHYNRAFDGYSYLGQSDSLNQGDEDMLHTFVFSDFHTPDKYPAAFHDYLRGRWVSDLRMIQELEFGILKALNIEGLLDLYRDGFGHMVSCNYYPPTEEIANTNDEGDRLTEHPDVSLFTIFPFGTDEDLQYQDQRGQWKSFGAHNSWVLFTGYFIEQYTAGKIKALNHRVKLNGKEKEERYSFAFFSLPKPGYQFKQRSDLLSSESYYKDYLSLF